MKDDFKAYTCVVNNLHLSIEVHLVMPIRIALIPLLPTHLLMT